MRRARQFRRSLTDNEKARFDEVFDNYKFVNLSAQASFDGLMSAMEAVWVYRLRNQ